MIGAVPALLCVFLQLRLKEPEKWVHARAHGQLTGKQFGSYLSLFGEAQWRKPALLGMCLCIAGVVGLWGVGFFSPELVGDVLQKAFNAQHLSKGEIDAEKNIWIGANMVWQNVGAFLGMITFTKCAQRFGRKPTFAVAYILAFLSTVGYFKLFNSKDDVWMSSIMGFCELGLFAGFAIYLPELFPTRLRSTGTSFCYNVGRFIALTGPLTLGQLQAFLAGHATTAAAKLEAFRNAACFLSSVFLLGLVALYFMEETKGRAMPEDVATT